jgi:hypothetical protein
MISIPDRVMSDFWWTKWHWGKFSASTSVSPANSHSTDCSTFIIIHLPGVVQWAKLPPTYQASPHPPKNYWFLAWLTLRTWWRHQYVPPKRRWISTGLNGVPSEKTVFLIVTTVKTSNPTITVSKYSSGLLSRYLGRPS